MSTDKVIEEQADEIGGDIFKELIDRAKNPFIYSFLVAWIINNWKVCVAYILYNSKTIEVLGVKTHIEYVNKNVTNWSGIYLPLISAFAYILVSPLLKSLVVIIATLIKSKTSSIIFKITGNAKVSADMYLEKETSLEASQKRFEEAIIKNQLAISEVSTLQKINQQHEIEKMRLNSEISQLSKNVEILEFEEQASEISLKDLKEENLMLLNQNKISKYNYDEASKGIMEFIGFYDVYHSTNGLGIGFIDIQSIYFKTINLNDFLEYDFYKIIQFQYTNTMFNGNPEVSFKILLVLEPVNKIPKQFPHDTEFAYENYSVFWLYGKKLDDYNNLYFFNNDIKYELRRNKVIT